MSRDTFSTSTTRYRDYPAPVSIRLTNTGPVTTITIHGELTYGTTHLLTDVVDRVVRQQAPRELVLDLAGVTFFCSAGIHALLDTRSRVAGSASRLVLYQPSETVRTVLVITGDDRHFDIRNPA